MNLNISKILAKDLLQKESKYIENGQLIFNRIAISSIEMNRGSVNFYYDDILLATTKLDCCPGSYSIFNFHLDEGSVKLHIETEPPDSTSYKRIDKAIAVLLKEIEAWKNEQ